jgi:hypothetical protein
LAIERLREAKRICEKEQDNTEESFHAVCLNDLNKCTLSYSALQFSYAKRIGMSAKEEF